MAEAAVDYNPEDYDEGIPEKQNIDTPDEEWVENLSPSDLVAIHVTDTFPSDQQIKSHVGWAESGKEIRGVRDTVHFTLNRPVVEDHGIWAPGSSWKKRNFVVLSPFEKFEKSQIANTLQADTFIKGDFDIPEGSHILVDWHEVATLRDNGIISNDEMQRYMAQMGLVDNYTGTSTDLHSDITIENGGVTYTLCDLSKDNFRVRILEERDAMDFHSGWPRITHEFREKYHLAMGTIHAEHPEVAMEHLGGFISNLIGLSLESVFRVIASGKDVTFSVNMLEDDIEKAVKDLERIDEGERGKPYLVKALSENLSFIAATLNGFKQKPGIEAKSIQELERIEAWINRLMPRENIEFHLEIEQTVEKYVRFYIKRLREGALAGKIQDYVIDDLERATTYYPELLKAEQCTSSDREKLVALFKEKKGELQRLLRQIDDVEAGDRVKAIISRLEQI